MNLKQWIGSVMSGIGLGLLLFIFIISNNLFTSNYNAYVITSGSMNPKIPIGSVVFTKTFPNYQTGDIITFTLNDDQNNIATHRISNIENDIITTKGDANEDPDRLTITQNNIIGKVFLTLPYLGYVADFAKTPKGFVTIIIIPAAIIIYEELKSIGFTLKSFFKNKLARLNTSAIGRGDSNKNNKLALFIIPIFGLFILFLKFNNTGAFFFDQETTTSNVLSTSTNFNQPTPSPSSPPISYIKIVINEIYYDVDSDHGDEGHLANPDEWVELYNPNDFDVNLKDWTLTDNNDARSISHANKYIKAYGFALVSKSAATWNYWSENSDAIKIELGQKIGNGLANGGDYLILKDNLNNLVDQIGWGDLTDFIPTHAGAPEGSSLERNPTGYDTDSSSDFIVNDTPTPGS